MNVTMKKTAAAMIVALMLASCSSNDGDYFSRQSESQGQTQPTQPVQPEQPTEPSQPTQPVQPEQPTEPSQPTQPVQPEQPTEPSQPSQPVQPTQPEQPSKPTQPAQPEQPTEPVKPQPEENKFQTLNKDGVELRKSSLPNVNRFTGYYPGDDGIAVVNEIQIPISENEHGINLSALSSKDTKNTGLLGLHQVKQGGFEARVPTEIEHKGFTVLDSNVVKDSVFKKDLDLNFIFINQPYSSYGMYYSDDKYVINSFTTDFFEENPKYENMPAVGLRNKDDSITEGALGYYDPFKEEYVWKEHLVGGVTYKGNVIATAQILDGNKYRVTEPQLDGQITINAKFNRNGYAYANGKLDSKLIGEVDLKDTHFPVSSGGGLVFFNAQTKNLEYSRIKASFDKSMTEAVGTISLRTQGNPIKDGEIKMYEAVFGATQQ